MTGVQIAIVVMLVLIPLTEWSFAIVMAQRLSIYILTKPRPSKVRSFKRVIC